MDVRSGSVRLGCLLAAAVVFAGATAPITPAGYCRRGDPETVSLADVRLPRADATDRVIEQALDLLEPFIHARPRVGSVKASEYRELPLAGLAGFRVCVAATGVIDPEIYINTETNMYRLAASHSLVGLVAVAATVVHEIEHGKPAGEADAYNAETAFVRHWVRTQAAPNPDRRILDRFLAALEKTTRELRRGATRPAAPR